MNNLDDLGGRKEDIERADIFDLELLQNYVDHNHGVDLAATSLNSVSKHALRGTKRLLKKKQKEAIQRKSKLNLTAELHQLYF